MTIRGGCRGCWINLSTKKKGAAGELFFYLKNSKKGSKLITKDSKTRFLTYLSWEF